MYMGYYFQITNSLESMQVVLLLELLVTSGYISEPLLYSRLSDFSQVTPHSDQRSIFLLCRYYVSNKSFFFTVLRCSLISTTKVFNGFACWVCWDLTKVYQLWHCPKKTILPIFN